MTQTHPISVLYVEDEETDRFFMQRAFECAGLAECLQTVNDGREAINYLKPLASGATAQGHLPDVLVLDLNLPAMSGFDLLKWIRNRPALRSLPVVIFSSSPNRSDRERAFALGATDYLVKPCSTHAYPAILDRIQKVWRRAPSSRTQRTTKRPASE